MAARHTSMLAAILLTPAHMAKLRVSLPSMAWRSRASFERQYLSRRATLAAGTVPPASLVHATVTSPLSRSLALTGTVRNLFNRAYVDPASDEHVPDAIAQNRRSVRVGLRWTFHNGSQ